MQIHQVSVVEVNEEVGKAACVELEKTYGADKALFFQCDVTDKEKLVSKLFLVASQRAMELGKGERIK